MTTPQVRAALQGRVLVLDALERAERNVLPTLNNLLENREMALDDGRFLMPEVTITLHTPLSLSVSISLSLSLSLSLSFFLSLSPPL